MKINDQIIFEHNLFKNIKDFINLEMIDPLEWDSNQSEIYLCEEDIEFRFIPYGKSGSIGNNINKHIQMVIQNMNNKILKTNKI